MNILKAFIKIVASPVIVAAEVVRDVSGASGESAQGASILTLGVSSVVKGAAKTIVSAAEDIIED